MRENFGKLVDKEIHLILKPLGFKRKSTTWSKKTETGFLVINRRCGLKTIEDLVSDFPSYRFRIWLGVYYEFVGPRKDHHIMWTPLEDECHVRASLYKTIVQTDEPDEGTWCVHYDASNFDEVLEDVRKNLKVALEFLEKYSDPFNAFTTMRTNPAANEIIRCGDPNSPIFHYIFAYLCLHLGEKQLALRSFEEIMKEKEKPVYATYVQIGYYSSLLSTIVSDDYHKLLAELNQSKEG